MLRRDRERREALAEAKTVKHFERVRRKLDAGACLLQPARLFQRDDTETLGRKRERGRQAADPGARDEDGARA
jgi:hypothetical protein